VIDIEEMNVQELEQLRDAVNQRLLQLKSGSGMSLPDLLKLLEEVKVTLKDRGKEWFSLERWQWVDGEIRFWLNPIDQANYQIGWYSIRDLIDWSHDRGPVLIELAPDDDEWTEIDGVRISWLGDGSRRYEASDCDTE
jgi:hypothetical protein